MSTYRLYRIEKNFDGSNTGGKPVRKFIAGTTEHLSGELAAIALKEGWAVPASPDSPAAGAGAEMPESFSVAMDKAFTKGPLQEQANLIGVEDTDVNKPELIAAIYAKIVADSSVLEKLPEATQQYYADAKG